MPTESTPWSGRSLHKLFLQDGQFTSTIIASLALTIGDNPQGIDWDGTNTPWCKLFFSPNIRKLMLTSGQFSSTLKTSLSVITIDTLPKGVSWDGEDSPWVADGAGHKKLMLQSGQFNSTLKTSLSVSAVDTTPEGISFTGCDTPWCGNSGDKLYLQSGQFTSTIKTSLGISPPNQGIDDISWDGTNTPWVAQSLNGRKLYLQSGQFNSTLKTSFDIQSILGGFEGLPSGISTDFVRGRLFGVSPFEEATDQAEEDAEEEPLWGNIITETPEPGGGGGGGGETPTIRIHTGFQANTWPEVGTLYDWDQLAAGFTWEEICGAAVLDADILSLRITKKLATVIDGITVGRCDFLLDNRDGRYSPESDNFAMRTNQPVGVKVITATGSVYSLFAGFVDRYTVQPARDRMTAHVGASDVAKFLRRKINLGLRIGVTPASLFEDVLVAAGIPAVFYDIATPTITDSITVAFVDNIAAGDAVGQIIKSGAHFAWVNNNGALTFRPRGTDKGLTSSQSYENSFFEFSYELDEQSVINDVEIKINPFRLPATAQQTVAWIEGPMNLTMQGSLSFLLDYRDPVTMAAPFPVNSIASPVASDDYLAFEECSGSGTNLTSQLSVTVTVGATAALVDIVNNGCPGCLTKFQLRGIPLIDEPSITIPAFNLVSQALHGTETLVIEQNIITDLAHNKDLALHLLTGSPQPEVRWSKKNWYPDLYLWDLFQKVSLVESNTAVGSIWLVEEIDHTIDLKRGHQHTLTARVFQESP